MSDRFYREYIDRVRCEDPGPAPLYYDCEHCGETIIRPDPYHGWQAIHGTEWCPAAKLVDHWKAHTPILSTGRVDPGQLVLF